MHQEKKNLKNRVQPKKGKRGGEQEWRRKLIPSFKLICVELDWMVRLLYSSFYQIGWLQICSLFAHKNMYLIWKFDGKHLENEDKKKKR